MVISAEDLVPSHFQRTPSSSKLENWLLLVQVGSGAGWLANWVLQSALAGELAFSNFHTNLQPSGEQLGSSTQGAVPLIPPPGWLSWSEHCWRILPGPTKHASFEVGSGWFRLVPAPQNTHHSRSEVSCVIWAGSAPSFGHGLRGGGLDSFAHPHPSFNARACEN